MTVAPVEGLGGIEARWRELGRIRLGHKGAKGEPRKLSCFRLTSPNRDVVEEAAALYGGTVKPWDGQYEVVTERDALDVLVPPTPGAFSQSWELWTADGCLRRCDGTFDWASDGRCKCPADLDERDKLAKAGKACRPTTRLSVLLPDLAGLGIWRLTTHGRNAAAELGAVRPILLHAMRTSMPFRAVLRLESRSSKRPGEARRDFVVPVLDVPVRVGRLLDSMGMIPALDAPDDEELPALPEPVAIASASDGAAGGPIPTNTAQASEGNEGTAAPGAAAPTAAAPAPSDAITAPQLAKLKARLRAAQLDDAASAELLRGRYDVETLTALSSAQAADLYEHLAAS